MFALKKLLDFRHGAGARRGAWEDEEKPFLDHLEDLRKTLFKLVITLGIALLACLSFHQQFFNFLLTPLKIAQLDRADLPEGVDSLRWNRAKLWAEIYAELPTDQAKAAYLARIGAIDDVTLEQQRAHRHLPQLSDLPQWMHFLGGRDQDQEGQQAARQDPSTHLETLLEAAAVYRAADSLKLDPKEKKRGEAPEEFIRAAASPAAADLALELWAKDAKPEVSPLATTLEMQALGPPEAFMMSMKIALYAAVIVSFPFLLFFLAEFIVPGLTQRERKAVYSAVGVGFCLFFIGVTFAFLVVVPRALTFFHDWGSDLGLSEQWRIGYYISFVTQLTLIFGVSFELPVIVLTLVKLGLVTVTTLRSGRLWAYLIIMVVGAIITPTPDAFTLSLLAGPMLVLYEITVFIAGRMEKKESRQAAEAEKYYRERAELSTTAIVEDSGDDDDPDDGPGTGPAGGSPGGGGGAGGNGSGGTAAGDGGGNFSATAPAAQTEVTIRPRAGLTPALGPRQREVAAPVAAGVGAVAAPTDSGTGAVEDFPRAGVESVENTEPDADLEAVAGTQSVADPGAETEPATGTGPAALGGVSVEEGPGLRPQTDLGPTPQADLLEKSARDGEIIVEDEPTAPDWSRQGWPEDYVDPYAERPDAEGGKPADSDPETDSERG